MNNKLLSIALAILVGFGAGVTTGLLIREKILSTTGVIRHVAVGEVEFEVYSALAP